MSNALVLENNAIDNTSLVNSELANPDLKSVNHATPPHNGVIGDDPVVLANIYEQALNIAVWQRQLTPETQQAVADLVAGHPIFRSSMTLRVDDALTGLIDELQYKEPTNHLARDIAQLVDMFGCLFELTRVGIRITVLSKAMCPKFHVDNVPCRLVTTYVGDATEWLPNKGIDRTKLGHGSEGRADHESGLYNHQRDIQQLNAGDIALLKGERWEGNEDTGLIHRSPVLKEGDARLLVTLDFSG
ncbi:succinylglutamate desuccinylase [Veronia nyctiphanis]|uniref:Succinylglutamate desuccinylase n=1 Tax=Veronia nyctiphanis TaxID=1278244 RepID=A0A4V1LT47_9GAMM|nr:DUF1826 domain-containing protein [Veronia nyctiphanis]RXJ73938.1 succinylglutamate desuccinylase [Veronia nyctiphanis]